MFFTPSSFARLITASDSSGATCPVASDRFSRAMIFSTSSVSGNTLPPAATLSPSPGSLRILCWLSASKVGSHTTLPRPPDMRWNHSTALGFTPPTARLSAIPPQISMPGTARLTSAARSAVGATWFFSTMPRMPLRAAMRATSKSSRLRLNASGSLWTWMSIAPAAGLTLGGGGGKPVCANSTMENASADAPAQTAVQVLKPFMMFLFLSELHRSLDRGPRGHFIRPARDVGKALEQSRLRRLHARDHAVERKVGDGHLAAGTVGLFCEPAVPDLHVVVPHRFERFDRRPVLVLGAGQCEDRGDHGAHVARRARERLPERGTRRGILGQELARFLGAVQQHRDRLRKRHRLSARAVAVDDHRDLPVRVHGEERGRFLLAFAEVEGMELVGEAAFFQPDARAHAVRSAGRVEVDHGLWLRGGR